MIESFRHKGLKRLFTEGNRGGVNPQQAERLIDILARLDVSASPEDMDLPGFRLHALKGDRKGQWAVSVSGNWRLVFAFEGEDAVEVDLVDYH